MKKHYQEEIPSENLLDRLDELEKEEAKVVWMTEYSIKIDSGIMTNIKTPIEMVRIIYKKEQ